MHEFLRFSETDAVTPLPNLKKVFETILRVILFLAFVSKKNLIRTVVSFFS